ncbi:PDGLE domain-containing protein [Glycomyces sp. L485]|uniref:PDGLE domain-containing protein n=1 Tax=Glycomyces sp. L485 TaxID=2909235 RepID=UPI001F4A4246|nr:PDGLE domain-containing protein [Glycomyces sp. L485]MCH7230680.1 PDGLE domain-containing protein [Glycomyces sp. L485]
MKTSRFVLIGALVALVLAGGVALFASSSPDGLESVMLDGCETGADGEISGGACTAQKAGEHEIGGPLADYGMSFVGSETLGGSLAGIVGVLLVLGIATGLFRLLARGPGPRNGEA